ncbi:MAG: hypothetical protein AMXMBFR4_02780 [Candidatus Hydrogenedentota bacterium]
MVTRPEAVLFDMGGVLLESADMWDDAGFPKSFPGGVPDGQSREWFMGMSKAILKAYEALPQPRPAMDARPIIAEWLTRAGIDHSNLEKWYRVLARWEVRPLYSFVHDALHRVAQMGFRIGLVSNTLMVSDYHRQLFRDGGILDLFECMVFSAEFGMNKPDPSIFNHALKHMRVEPARAWYVGDKPHRDVCGAHSVGMTAALVDSIYEHRTNDGPEFVPDLRIRDLRELPPMLERLSDLCIGGRANAERSVRPG